MGAYEPREGDEVVVTLRGRVRYSDNGFLNLPNGSVLTDRFGVKVEKVSPPLPTTPGSVVRYCGHTYMLNSDGRWRGAHPHKPGRSNELYEGVAPSECTVLFDAGKDA